MVVTNTGNSLKGTIVVSNCDKESLSQSKDTLSDTLTQKVQTDTKNSNSQVQVNQIRELSDGTLALDYECTGVSDQKTAKSALNTAVQQDDVKQTIVQSSKSDASNTGDSKQQKANQPNQPAVTTQPPAPTTTLPASTTKPPAPTTQTAAPTTQTAAPTTKQPAPTTQTAAPTTQTPAPTTKPPAPTTQTAAPTTQTAAPTTKPPAPTTQTAAPTTQTPAPTTKPPAPTTQTAAPTTQTAAPTTKPPAPTTQTAAPTTQPTTASKATKATQKALKSSKPSTVDCDKDHKVTAQDDKNINGVLVVKSCHATRFARKPSRCTNVGNKLGSLVKNRLDKVGIKGQFPVKIVKTSGDKTQTEFHYTIPCDKSQQQTVIQSLKDSCKDKDFVDTITEENQPDEDDSSSESDSGSAERSTQQVVQRATPQDKVAATTTEQPIQRKTAKVGSTKKPSATKRTVQMKNCDDDDSVREDDDQTMTGKIVVQDCPCEKRFKNNRTRLAVLSATLDKQLRTYYQQLYNTKINYKCNVKVLSGNSTHTVFTYTVQIPKSDHTRARAAFKLLCKDDEVKKTIETASIKQEGDDDSDSSEANDNSSSEEGQTVATIRATTKKIPAAPTEKSTESQTPKNQAVSTTLPSVTSKVATKSGKTLKPSKPSTVDCDKDHKVIAQDDKNINGVLIVKSCHATRFARKPSRCANVGNKLGSLVKTRLDKVGIKGQFPVNIVKTSGDKTQTEFHYTIPCDKSQQQTVIQSLKDSCKDKDFVDTITAENQPDEDDSSSESDEDSAEGATTKFIQKEASHGIVTGTSEQSTQRKIIKAGATKKPPTTKRTVQVKNCDDDNNIRSEDDQTISGKIIVEDCPCEKRFKNNATRLAVLSATIAKQLRAYYQKLYGTSINYKCIVNVLSGNNTHTVFTYTVKIPKADHTRARAALKLMCKDEEVKKTIETASIKQEGDEDSDSSSSEEDQTVAKQPAVTKKATVAPTEKQTQPERTQKLQVSTTAAGAPSKVATKSGKTLKPSKPSTVDCDKDHKITAQDDKNINGVLIVRSCHASRFARKRSR
ncbi:unnamed protein product, partial [Rotaria sp. Silwood2]